MRNTYKILLSTLGISGLSASVLLGATSCSGYTKFNAKVVGHRGCPSNKNVFENTIGSFEAAGQSDYYSAIECDVWPNATADQLYVVHDEYPFYQDPKASVANIEYDLAESYTLHASANYPRENPGSFDHDSATKNYKLPTLEEYLQVCAKYQKTAVIELKDTVKWTSTSSGIWTDEAINQLSEAVNRIITDKNYILISFDNSLLEHIATGSFNLPKQKMQQLFDPSLINSKSEDEKRWGSWEYIADQGWNIDVGDALSPSTLDWGAYINSYFVEYFHNKNLEVNVWTVNTLDRAKALDSLGVDYITTDWIL